RHHGQKFDRVLDKTEKDNDQMEPGSGHQLDELGNKVSRGLRRIIMNFTQLAEKVLRETKEPMIPNEIWEKAVELGWNSLVLTSG
ncbi:MAG TPA: hypothetical protein DEA22_07250, partial [Blastocatellia bacterium]|nr:hypothetical protein [Blastocatellia bacterium]